MIVFLAGKKRCKEETTKQVTGTGKHSSPCLSDWERDSERGIHGMLVILHNTFMTRKSIYQTAVQALCMCYHCTEKFVHPADTYW